MEVFSCTILVLEEKFTNDYVKSILSKSLIRNARRNYPYTIPMVFVLGLERFSHERAVFRSVSSYIFVILVAMSELDSYVSLDTGMVKC